MRLFWALTLAIGAIALFTPHSSAQQNIFVTVSPVAPCAGQLENSLPTGIWIAAATSSACMVDLDGASSADVRISFNITPQYGKEVKADPIAIGFEVDRNYRSLLQPFEIQPPTEISADGLDHKIRTYWSDLMGSTASLSNARSIWEHVLWAYLVRHAHGQDGNAFVHDDPSSPDCSEQNVKRTGRIRCLAAIVERGCNILSSTPPTRVAVVLARYRRQIGVCAPVDEAEAKRQLQAALAEARPFVIDQHGRVRDVAAAAGLVQSAAAYVQDFHVDNSEIESIQTSLTPILRSSAVMAYMHANRFEFALGPRTTNGPSNF